MREVCLGRTDIEHSGKPVTVAGHHKHNIPGHHNAHSGKPVHSNKHTVRT